MKANRRYKVQHSFQPYENDILTMNPFKINEEPALLTCGTEGHVNTMTISWGGLGVIWNKDVGFVFIRGSRYTKEFLDKYDTFSVTYFAPDKPTSLMLKYIGSVSGRDENKIENARFHVDFYNGTPYIDEGRDVVIMKKLSVTKINPEDFVDPELDKTFYENKDYHYMYIGEVIQLMSR